MDVFTLVENYMNKMFSGVEGMKILLVDRETVMECYFYIGNHFFIVRNYKFGHVSIKVIRARCLSCRLFG